MREVETTQPAEEVWVIPSFHTKSTRVIKTPQREIDW